MQYQEIVVLSGTIGPVCTKLVELLCSERGFPQRFRQRVRSILVCTEDWLENLLQEILSRMIGIHDPY